MKKIKIKISKRQILRYYFILLLLVCIALIGYSTLFLYKYVYKTIYNYEEIAQQYQSTHKTKEINMQKFNKIIDNIENKSQKNYDTRFKSIF